MTVVYGRGVLPRDFQVSEFVYDPSPGIRLTWTPVAKAHWLDVTLHRVSAADASLTLGPSKYNSVNSHHAHQADIVGYRLYRGVTSEFTPGVGNLLADETTLTPGISEYLDSTAVPGTSYFYLIVVVGTI